MEQWVVLVAGAKRFQLGASVEWERKRSSNQTPVEFVVQSTAVDSSLELQRQSMAVLEFAVEFVSQSIQKLAEQLTLVELLVERAVVERSLWESVRLRVGLHLLCFCSPRLDLDCQWACE
jgi:glucan biosynthesis protein